jgi:hypothetical protein
MATTATAAMAMRGFLFMACVLAELLRLCGRRDVIKLKFEFEVFSSFG